MSDTISGEGSPSRSPSTSGSPDTGPSVRLMHHFERMIPYVQLLMHTNIFHTEHEDYAFWSAALTAMVEWHMVRPAVAIPQSKIWLLPEKVLHQVENLGKKKSGNTASTPSTPSNGGVQSGSNNTTPATASPSDEPTIRTNIVPSLFDALDDFTPANEDVAPDEDTVQDVVSAGNDVLAANEGFHWSGEEARKRKQMALHSIRDALETIPQGTDVYATNGDALPQPTNPASNDDYLLHEPPAASQEEDALNNSFSSIRTTDTKNTRKVITDFAVLTPRHPDMLLDPSHIRDACTKVRAQYGSDESVPHGIGADFIKRYRADDQNRDEDDGDDGDDEDYEDGSARCLPRSPLPPHDFNLRTRPSPPPISATPAITSDQDTDNQGADLEYPDWMDEMIDKAGFDAKSPSDEPCNMKAAFQELANMAKFKELASMTGFNVAILCESKQTASRGLGPRSYNKKSRFQVRAGMRSLLVQVAYLLTSEAWKHQDRVIGMVTLGDQFCWNEFERIRDRKPMENWTDYTFETRPFNTCRAWSNLVQWGTPAAEEAIQIMMARVNAIFPATMPPAPPPASESSQDDSSSSPDFTLADLSTPSSRAASGEQAQNGVDPNLPVDEFWDEPYDPDADELQEDAQDSASDPASSEIDVPDIVMGDAPASVVTPAPRLRWRELERHDTQETDFDADGSGPVDDDADDPNDGGLSGRPLQGETTLATFEAFASVSLRNTHETAPPPANADNDSGGGSPAPYKTIDEEGNALADYTDYGGEPPGDDNNDTPIDAFHVDLGDANDNFASVDAIDGGGHGDSVALDDDANDGDDAIADPSANVHHHNGASAPANTGGGEDNVHAAPAHGGGGASNVITAPALGGGNAPANPTVNPDNSRKRYASPDSNTEKSGKQTTKKVRLMSPDVGDPSASQAGPSGTQPKKPAPARKKGKQAAGPARDSKGRFVKKGPPA
ncbi:hypothetical protein HDZ31DRAFT_63076 [Schizophyllum fasciatum]